MKQTLTLTRNNDNDAIFKVNAVDTGKITLNKILWYMLHEMPADKDKIYNHRAKKENHYMLDIE